MLRFITDCAELRTGETPIIEMINESPVDRKDDILKYMKSGKDDGVRCSSIYDFVLGCSTGDTIHCYKDDEFEWDDTEIYHFEKYNILLDPQFINKALKSSQLINK